MVEVQAAAAEAQADAEPETMERAALAAVQGQTTRVLAEDEEETQTTGQTVEGTEEECQ